MADDLNATVPRREGVWLWRAISLAALAGAAVGLFLSHHHALLLLAASGVMLAAAMFALPRAGNSLFVADFLLGLPGGLAFGITFLGLALAQGELRLSRASATLVPFTVACLVAAVFGLFQPALRARLARDAPTQWNGAGFIGVVAGLIFGAGLVFLFAGYFGIPVELL